MSAELTVLNEELWENMLDNAATEDCQSLKQLCMAVEVLCKATNAASPVLSSRLQREGDS